MATFYWDNDTTDGEWNTVGNWRMDNFTATRVAASVLPGVADDVVFVDSGAVMPLGGATVANATFYGGVNGSGNTLIVTGLATFTVSLNNPSANAGTVDGNAAFTGGASTNEGTVTGDATFFYAGGDAVDGPYNHSGGVVGGNATFFGASNQVGGTVMGNAEFDGWYGGNIYATVQGDAVFRSGCHNYGDVGGDAIFYDTSYNEANVSGDALFEDDSYNGVSGIVSGNATFRGNSHNRSALESSSVTAERGKGVRGSHILGLP